MGRRSVEAVFRINSQSVVYSPPAALCFLLVGFIAGMIVAIIVTKAKP